MGILNLEKLFNSIRLPVKTASFELNATPVPNFNNHRIARDKSGYPVLLLYVKSQTPQSFIPSIKLQNISADFDVKCKIRQNSLSFESSFNVIRFLGQDVLLRNYFFELSESLLYSLSSEPTQEEVKEKINYFIELFRFINEPPLKTVQGLWAELFLIAVSPNPSALISFWHLTPEEKFDFSNGKERIEVKSAATNLRIHSFSIEQLNPPKEVKVFIASFFVFNSISGLSIQDLEEGIIAKLNGNINFIDKVKSVIAKTLGSALQSGRLLKFDSQVALDSLRFYKSEDIPKISFSAVPPNVFGVKFRANLESISEVNHTKILDKYFSEL